MLVLEDLEGLEDPEALSLHSSLVKLTLPHVRPILPRPTLTTTTSSAPLGSHLPLQPCRFIDSLTQAHHLYPKQSQYLLFFHYCGIYVYQRLHSRKAMYKLIVKDVETSSRSPPPPKKRHAQIIQKVIPAVCLSNLPCNKHSNAKWYNTFKNRK